VCGAAEDFVDVKTVGGKPRLSGQELQRLLASDLENLRLDEGDFGAERRTYKSDLLTHPLMLSMPRVLVGLQIGVGGNSEQGFSKGGHALERVGQRRWRRAERPFHLPDCRNLGLEFLLRHTPGRIRRVYRCEIPFVLVGNAGPVALLCAGRNNQSNQREGNEGTPDHGISISGLLYNREMQAPTKGIIVKIVETNEISGLGDVMLDAIGLTGVIAVGAALFGLVLAVVIISYRKVNARLHPDEDAQTQSLGLTPTGGQ
jgi:hypothetical protein